MTMSLRIATWNVNSIRARIGHLADYLADESPDILLLQETKIEDHAFPREVLEERGYNLALYGQKTYNGVAIASRLPLEDVQFGLPGDSSGQARYIQATLSLPQDRALCVASVYVPNGQAVDSEKFPYKLHFLELLRQHAKELLRHYPLVVMGGDYNVAPYPVDVFDPSGLDGSVCYHPLERERFRALLHAGLYDAYRVQHPQTHAFSWWDYRQNAFARNHGLRIDHLLLSAQAVDHMIDCTMSTRWRALEKPSDHVPVTCSLMS